MKDICVSKELYRFYMTAIYHRPYNYQHLASPVNLPNTVNPFDPVSAVLMLPEGAFRRLRKIVLLACANLDQADIIVRYLGSTSMEATHCMHV